MAPTFRISTLSYMFVLSLTINLSPLAAETIWTADGSGAYTDGSKWSAGAPNTDNTDAKITSGANVFTGTTNIENGVHLQLAGGTLTTGGFYVGPTYGQSGTFSVAQGAVFSTASSSFFGYRGAGVYNLNGTHLQTGNNVWVGDQSTTGKSNGTLNLAGALRIYATNKYLVCGNAGDGVVNQTAGLAAIPFVQIGISSGTGWYKHTGGTVLLTTSNLSTVTPTAAQEGKVCVSGGKMTVGANGIFASTAEMVVDSGTVTVASGGSLILDSTIPTSDPSRVAIGHSGSGKLTVNGGLVDLNGGMSVARNAGSTGSVELVSGTIDATGSSSFIGYYGDATMVVQAGGEFIVGENNLWIANQAGTTTLTIDGGKLTSTGYVNISDRASATGTVDLKNGATAKANSLIIGSQGKGTVNVANGSFIVSGATTLGNDSTTAQGNLNLTENATYSTASMSIKRGKLTLADNATLKVTGTLSKDATGTLTVTGGMLNAKDIDFGLSLSAGTLIPGGLGEIGSTSINGDLALSGTASVLLDIDAALGTADSLTTSGVISASENAMILIDLLHPESLHPGQSFTLLESAGALPSDNIQFSESIRQWFLAPDFTNGNLTLSVDGNAVPEPTTWALLLFGALLIPYWFRKK